MRRACLVVVVVAGACSPTSPPEPAAPVVSAPPVGSPPSPPPVVIDAAVAALPIDAAPAPPIVEAPITWNTEREKLTLEYRRRHVDPAATDVTITPRAIVLHYTGGNSAKGTRSYFDNIRIEAERKQLAAAGAVNVSSHYLVDRDGTIYRLQPDTRFARHCIGLNHLAIGVENVGDGNKWPLTDAQVTANAALVRMLAREHAITHLLGHHEVMGFQKHAYFVEREPAYRNDKPDPGAAFMTKVRARVDDLALAGP